MEDERQKTSTDEEMEGGGEGGCACVAGDVSQSRRASSHLHYTLTQASPSVFWLCLV